MVEQRSDFHYSDDDLTIDRSDSEPLDPSVVDLFDYLGDDSSPISRLKALVLSIDWEITDEVLQDFNEELLSLHDVWGGDPIKVVYLQALEKISKYIYRTQSDAHPDAIKLLPLLFVDLEKIVQSGRKMSEDEKKRLLVEDVRRFERLKAQILERHRGEFAVPQKPAPLVRQATGGAIDHDGVKAINRLKALILGIDWEITEKDLMALRREVLHLEDIFVGSRPKQLFLQGIGTLSAYIRNKKSNAHADAFSLLHDFFAGLEQVVTRRLEFPAEKAVLLPLVARFNAFKETIASTLSAEAIARSKQAVLEEEAREDEEAGPLQPAFADLPDDTHGFHIEKEAVSSDVPEAVIADIEKFFAEEDGPPLTKIADGKSLHDPFVGAENPFGQSAVADPSGVAPEVALRGINVETEADDDSGEAALPRQGGQLAPALNDEPVFPYTYGQPDVTHQAPAADSEIPEEISGRLDDLFSMPAAPAPAPVQVASPVEKMGNVAFAAPPSVALRSAEVDAVDANNERDRGGAPVDLLGWQDEGERKPAPAFANIDTPRRRRDDEGEPEMEFSSVSEGEPNSFLSDDELDESEEGGSGEIVPALSGFDDADLPERSDFAEEDDGPLAAVENEEILAFFQNKSSDAAEDATPSREIEKPETLMVDEFDFFETPRRPNHARRQNFAASLDEEAMPGQMPEMPAVVDETGVDEAEQDEVIAFRSDDVFPSVETLSVADGSVGEELVVDESELFIDDIFADQSAPLPAAAKSAAEPDVLEFADSNAAGEPLAIDRDYSQGVDFDIDDEPNPVAAIASAEIPARQPSASFLGDISLHECVDALADEINDDILNQSYRQVRRLRAELDRQPFSEIYLQFISAIMQHIDQRRADASDEALPLLRQMLAHFEESQRNGEAANIQRFLLDDVQTVLSWQQSLLEERSPARSWL